MWIHRVSWSYLNGSRLDNGGRPCRGLLLGFPGALLALPFVAVWQVVLREARQR